ncbi:MAG TPA: hypothetical protein PLZ36_17565, partial [Armatimonadota bacterium]|nr:hypothetical protein [Armatimonadota bacterium]
MKSFLSALRDGYVADIDATSTVYAGFGPVERPDAYVQLIPAGGIPLEWPGGEWRIGQFQVVHVGRVTAIRAALEAAEAAYEALHERVNWELDGYRARFVE